MHILLGAAIGAIVGVVGAIVMAKIMGQPVTRNTIIAGLVGGAVGGAITAATFGAGGAVAATAARAATAYVAGGAGGGGTTRAVENLLDGKPVQQGVVESTAVGGASGLLFFGLGRAVAPVVERFAPRLAFLGRAPPEPEAPKAPPWENYPWRVKPPAEPGQTVRVKIVDLRTRQVTIDHHGLYSETQLYDPIAGQVTTDASKGVPMIPDVSWVDWIEGQEPFWALREGNHRTFDALLEGREDVLAKVVFVSQKTAESSLWAERPYEPFLRSGVWDVNENFMGRADQFKGLGRANMSFFRNPLTAPGSPSKTPGFVSALGGD